MNLVRCVFVVLILLGSQPVLADMFQKCEVAEADNAMSEVKQIVIDILSKKTFKHCREITHWELLGDEPETRDIPDWLKPILQSIAALLEWILWIGMGILFSIIAFFVLSWRRTDHPRNRKPQHKVTTVLGMNVRSESLPNDIPSTVWSLWQQNQHRSALGLLYRATLTHLLAQGVQFETSFTEGDCQQAIKILNNSELNNYFNQLTIAWQQLAYAHQKPSSDAIQQLCTAWHSIIQTTQDHSHE